MGCVRGLYRTLIYQAKQKQSSLFNSGLYWVVAIDYSICDRAAKFYHPLKRDNFTVFLCQVIAEYELNNIHTKVALEEDH